MVNLLSLLLRPDSHFLPATRHPLPKTLGSPTMKQLVISVPLIVALVATPWFFGGVWTRTQAFLLALCGGLLLIDVLVGMRLERRQAIVPVALYPLAGGILLGLFQLWPLNADGAAKFAPGAVKWRAQAAYVGGGDVDRDGGTEVAGKGLHVTGTLYVTGTRSLYPPATRENVALLLLVTSVFWLASRRMSDSQCALLLLAAVTVCGVALALFALVQRFTWNGQIYWTYPLSQGGNAFGPFVNRNNAGGFLNLCLAAGLGTYVWESGGGSRLAGDEWRGRREFAKRENGKREFGAPRMLAVGALVFISGAIVASASRGSVLSLVFGMAVVAAGMLTRRGRRSQGLGVVVAAVAALSLVVWLGQLEEVRTRFSDMASADSKTDQRLLNWAEAGKAIPDFWFLGSGLNTYRFVCPPFQERLTGDRWHYYAENQYFQSLVDGGVVGLSLLLLTIGLVGWSIVRLFGVGGRLNTAIATMGSYALASQMVGGAFDFGLYLGANAILFAAICGLVVGRAALQVIGSSEDSQPFEPPKPGRNWLVGQSVHGTTALGVSVLLLIGATFGAVELQRAADVESVVEAAVLGRIAEQRDDRLLAAAIGAASEAVRRRADDANGHRALTEMWIQRYRVATFRSLRQQQPWLDEEESWQASSLLNLNSTLRDLDAGKRAELQNQIRGDVGAQSLLRPAWQHARRARVACPWVPQTYLTLASLAPFVRDGSDTAEHLEKARQYAGGDPTIWYRIGLLEMVAGRTDQALLSWQRSLALSWQYENLIVAELLGTVSVDEMLSVLSDDLVSRLRLAKRLRARFPDEARRLAAATLEMLEAEEKTAATLESGVERSRGEACALRAGVLRELDQNQASIAAWREALAESPDRTDWRTELVEMLLAAGQASQAYDEVLICLSREPDSAKLQALQRRCKTEMLKRGG